MRKTIPAAALMLLTAASAPGPRLDAVVHAGMLATGAKGLAVAVVENGRVVFQRAYGARNAKGDPLTENSVMYGASLTKTVFAYTILQLAGEGKLDLDTPVGAMLPKPLPEYGNLDAYGNWGDLAGDLRWAKITPRHVLTHSTGFANFHWDEPDERLRIHFQPGAAYAYSGEGMMLLQFGLEQGLGLDMGEEMDRRVFRPLGMTKTSLKWRADFATDLADGWRADGTVEPHDERSRVRVAGSMDTTVADMARFAAALHRFQQLAELGRPQLAITTRAQFPSFQSEAPPAERVPNLSAGLGVVTFRDPRGSGFFKGGHNGSTGNTLVCVDRARRCVVILANDVRAEPAFPSIVRAALGDVGVPWRWEYPQLPSAGQ